MELSRENTVLWRRLLWAGLGIYVFYGIWRSASVDIPVQGLEGMIAYYRMASMWESASLAKLVNMPWWLIATGVIPLYIFCVPFFAMFGATLFSLQIASFVWNLIGLWLIARSIDGARERFFAIALLIFGVPTMTEIHLAASGTYTDIFLPFGVVVLIQRYFLTRTDEITALRAALLSGVIAIVTAFMPTMFPGTLAMCVVTVLGLPGENRKRLLWPLVAGGGAASALMLPMLLAQVYPSNAVHLDLLDYPGKLAELLIAGFPNFLELRGLPGSGYPLAAMFYFVCYRWLRSGQIARSPRESSLMVAAVVFIIWLPMNTHFDTGAPEPDIIRFRQLSSAWPFWALFLATVVEWLDRQEFPRRLRQGYQWVLLGTVAACIIALFGALNWRAWGVTTQIRLDSIAGRTVDEVLPHFNAPGRFEMIEQAPEEYRATLAMLSSLSRIITADMGDFLENIMDDKVRVPSHYLQPYWVGVGLIACEGSMRNGPLVQRKLPELLNRVRSEERNWIRRGCEYGTHWREGEIYFTELGWPLEPRVIETGSARLWGDTIRYRSRR